MPSTTTLESFGIVQIESLAMGTPVICYEIPHSGVGSLNINMETGIVIQQGEDNIKLLKDAMLKLLKNENLLEKMKSNALNRAKEFHFESHKNNYKKFFEKTIMNSFSNP